MKNCLLQGKNISKSFSQGGNSTDVLHSIDLDIFEGSFTVVMGSSGAGKSTLLHVLGGMDAPSSGAVLFQGEDITNLPEKQMARLRADEFGFVFQRTHLVSSLTLYENILLAGLVTEKLSEADARERTTRLIERVGLTDAKDRLPSAVSGGEAQRAAVARAVIGGPSILFADEPTGALNRKSSEEVLDILTSLAGEGQTVLLVTHDLQAALRGVRVLYLNDGRITGDLSLPAYRGPEREREETLARWLEGLRW